MLCMTRNTTIKVGMMVYTCNPSLNSLGSGAKEGCLDLFQGRTFIGKVVNNMDRHNIVWEIRGEFRPIRQEGDGLLIGRYRIRFPASLAQGRRVGGEQDT